MTARTLEFFKTYDLLLTPATIVRAVPGREPLCRRMRRQEIRQLRRMARHRLRDHAGVLPGAVAAMRLHRLRPAGRTADGGAAARRGAAACRRQGAGGYSGRARHHADRSEAAEIAEPSRPIRSGRITMPMERFQFAGSEGHQLAAALDLPEREPIAYALFAHCFTCGKDVLAAQAHRGRTRQQGHRGAAVRFHRARLQRRRFRQFDLLLQRRRSRARRRSSAREPAKPPAILIGHSLGGAAILAAAGQIPDAKAIVTIAAPSDPAHVTHFFADRIEDIRKPGQGRGLARRPAIPYQTRIPRRHRRA